MARWEGEADKDAEKPSGKGGGFEPAPRGFYTIQVADYKDGITANTKRPKVDLTCEIVNEGPEFGKKVWITVTQIPKGEKGHGIMLHTLHAFGIELDGGPYGFDTEAFQGQQANVLLGVEPRTKEKDGKTYTNMVNFVEELYTEKHPQPDELPAPREAKAPAAAAKPATTGAKIPAAVSKAFPGAKVKGKQEEVPF